MAARGQQTLTKVVIGIVGTITVTAAVGAATMTIDHGARIAVEETKSTIAKEADDAINKKLDEMDTKLDTLIGALSK